MVVFLHRSVRAGFFAPAVELKFSENIRARFVEFKPVLFKSGADLSYSGDNIVVSLNNSEFSVSADTLDKACSRGINDYP